MARRKRRPSDRARRFERVNLSLTVALSAFLLGTGLYRAAPATVTRSGEERSRRLAAAKDKRARRAAKRQREWEAQHGEA